MSELQCDARRLASMTPGSAPEPDGLGLIAMQHQGPASPCWRKAERRARLWCLECDKTEPLQGRQLEGTLSMVFIVLGFAKLPLSFISASQH
jgi:hypothetical protein